eukprot:SAG22_NODE_23859_length_130_cov_43.612903_1_plen_26_part_10
MSVRATVVAAGSTMGITAVVRPDKPP